MLLSDDIFVSRASLGLGPGEWPQFLASDGECHIEGLSNEVVGIRRRRHAVRVGVEFDQGQVL